MGKTYFKTFITSGDIDEVFESAKQFLHTRDFTIKSLQKPNTLIATRGSTAGSFFSTKIEKTNTYLRIDLQQQNGEIFISCNYSIYAPTSMITAGDTAFLESEVEMLRTNLQVIFTKIIKSNQITPRNTDDWFCQDCGRKNPVDFLFCGNCGQKKR